MAERLVILSDMWGCKKDLWITSYLGYLQPYFDITFYDSQQLAGIESKWHSEENLMNEFFNGGIDRGVAHLLRKENEKSHYLTFCAGGAIGWKANLLGLPIKSLYIVAAGGLEDIVEKPTCPVTMVYGDLHTNKPSEAWSKKIGIPMELVPNFGRELYTDEKIITRVCQDLLGMVMQKAG